ncbi:ankyrin repeat domain-containing protein [Endozoicomonas elysicola]|uniref:Uncharacterized protein n=1 Tax=Endozoicomonas elysicola TaxID=305900 RepID=A0A081KDG0_9GAMM|nr:ankyrin repeat domain-containing protein [Endozoicomonas elysicola]KEI72186.1 hypothetical protein GV64_16930 [Endozoicomonas elysicola]
MNIQPSQTTDQAHSLEFELQVIPSGRSDSVDQLWPGGSTELFRPDDIPENVSYTHPSVTQNCSEGISEQVRNAKPLQFRSAQPVIDTGREGRPVCLRNSMGINVCEDPITAQSAEIARLSPVHQQIDGQVHYNSYLKKGIAPLEEPSRLPESIYPISNVSDIKQFLGTCIMKGATAEEIRRMLSVVSEPQYILIIDHLLTTAIENENCIDEHVRLQVIQVLLKPNAHYHAGSHIVARALETALVNGRNEHLTDYLLRGIGSPEIERSPFSLVTCAVKSSIKFQNNNYQTLIPKLLAKGGDLNGMGEMNPLFQAAIHQRVDMVEYLLNYGADPDACTHGRYNPLFSVVTQLLKPSLYPSFLVRSSTSPIHISNYDPLGYFPENKIIENVLEITNGFIARNLARALDNQLALLPEERRNIVAHRIWNDIFLKPLMEKIRLAESARCLSSCKAIAIIKLLLEKGADPDGNIRGRADEMIPTPLQQVIACWYILDDSVNSIDKKEIISLMGLFQRFGATLDRLSDDQIAPILMSSLKGNLEMAAAVLRYGADPDAIKTANTRCGLSRQDDPPAVYQFPKTPLYAALVEGFYHIAYEIYMASGCTDPRDVLDPGSQEHEEACMIMRSMFDNLGIDDPKNTEPQRLRTMALREAHDLWYTNRAGDNKSKDQQCYLKKQLPQILHNTLLNRFDREFSDVFI